MDFDYWSVDLTLPVTADMNVYALYTLATVPVYGDLIVKYSGNGNTGGVAPNDDNWYFAGDLVTVLGQGSLTRNGYTFFGWSTSPAWWDTTVMYAAGSTFTIYSDVTLYAVWLVADYTVTFEPGVHGTFAPQVTSNLRYGDATPAVPSVTGEVGWSFNGWLPALSATVTGTVTYVAQWVQATTPTLPPTTPPAVDPTPTPTSTPTPNVGSTEAPTTPSTATPTPSDVTVTPSGGVKDVLPGGPVEWSATNSVVSVIGVISAVVAAVWLLLVSRSRGNVRAGESFLQHWTTWLIAAVVLSVVSVLVFLLTQDLSLPFGWMTDRWTMLHVALLIVESVMIYIGLQKKIVRLK
jgi:hypothetical protein